MAHGLNKKKYPGGGRRKDKETDVDDGQCVCANMNDGGRSVDRNRFSCAEVVLHQTHVGEHFKVLLRVENTNTHDTSALSFAHLFRVFEIAIS